MAAYAYRVIETTFEVIGGTPVEGLEQLLNDKAAEGWRLVTSTRVRGPESVGVDVIVLERVTE